MGRVFHRNLGVYFGFGFGGTVWGCIFATALGKTGRGWGGCRPGLHKTLAAGLKDLFGW